MALSKYSAGSESSFDKWKIALAIGGTILAGAGIYYILVKSNFWKHVEASDSVESLQDDSLSFAKEISEADSKLSPLERSQSLKNKGNTHFRSGKYTEAIKCYTEAIEICPQESTTDISTFYQNRAAAYEQLKNWENVLKDCTTALSLNSRYVKALQRRAKACEFLNDLEQALEDLTTICVIEAFQNQSTLLNVDRILKQLGQQHAREALENKEPVMPSKHYINTFFESFAEDPIFNSVYKEKEGDVDEIETISQKNVSNNGYLKAKQYLQEGKYGEIINCCSNELANPLTPFKAEACLLRATMSLLTGDTKQAGKDLTSVIDLEDASVKMKANAYIKRGALSVQTGNVDESLKDFNKAAEIDPQNSDVFHHRGQIYLLAETATKAMDDFKRAVELNPNFPIAYVQKCYTDYRYAHQMGDKAKVEQVMGMFEEAIKNFPKCVECYVLYAQVLCDQNEYQRADEYYVKAIEVDPENPTTLVHRALLILQWRGDLEAARRYITQALDMDDKCELAYENLATVEVQTGNLKRGIELFEKAISFAKTEMEMSHLFSLRDAAVAQLKVVEKMGISLQSDWHLNAFC